jgi:hypothetical protein
MVYTFSKEEKKMGLFDFLKGGQKRPPALPKYNKPEPMPRPTRSDSLLGRVEKLEELAKERRKDGK